MSYNTEQLFTANLRGSAARRAVLVFIISGLITSLNGRGFDSGAQPAGPPSAEVAPPASDAPSAALTAVQTANAAGDLQALRAALLNTDPAVEAAAFDALAARDSASAVNDLLTVLRDPAAPNGVQTLELLDRSPQADEQAVLSALHDASNEPLTVSGQYAMQALTTRDHPADTPPPSDEAPSSDVSTDTAGPAGPDLQGSSTNGDAAQNSPQDSGPPSPPETANAQTEPEPANAQTEREPAASADDLVARFRDTGLPVSTRLKALQGLNALTEADQGIVMMALREALNDPDAGIRACAVQALSKRATPEAVSALTEALHGSDPALRLLVVESLGQSDAGIPLVREAISDSDEKVRNAAAALLRQAEERAAGKR